MFCYASFALQEVHPTMTGDPRWRNRLPGHTVFVMVFGLMVFVLSCHGGFSGIITVTQIFHKVSYCFQQSIMARHFSPTHIQWFCKFCFR